MSHISLFILRKTNNPDDCADLVALKTQIFLVFFFFCLKLAPDYCFYNKREQVHMGKWAKLVKRWKSGEFEGFFSPLTAVYVNLLETNQPGLHFLSTCLAANHSSASLKKKREENKLFIQVGMVTHRWAWSFGQVLECWARLDQNSPTIKPTHNLSFHSGKHFVTAVNEHNYQAAW